MDFCLDGKKVLVAGATGGLGRAVALGLAAEGAHLALTSRHLGPDLLTLAEEINLSGPQPVSVAMDLEDLTSVRAAVEASGVRSTIRLSAILNVPP